MKRIIQRLRKWCNGDTQKTAYVNKVNIKDDKRGFIQFIAAAIFAVLLVVGVFLAVCDTCTCGTCSCAGNFCGKCNSCCSCADCFN